MMRVDATGPGKVSRAMQRESQDLNELFYADDRISNLTESIRDCRNKTHQLEDELGLITSNILNQELDRETVKEHLYQVVYELAAQRKIYAAAVKLYHQLAPAIKREILRDTQ